MCERVVIKARVEKASITETAVNRMLDTMPSSRRLCDSDDEILSMPNSTFMLACDS